MTAKRITVGPLTARTTEAGASCVEGRITIGATSHDVWWKITGAEAAPRIEAHLAIALQMAMALGAHVHVEGPVSGRLLDALPELQSIWKNFDPHLGVIDVEAERAPPRPPADGVALCFSLGVDGFYSLVDRLDEVTHLVLIHGVDYEPESPYRVECSQRAREVAEATGKTLVEISTNYRYLVEPHPLSKRMTPTQASLGAALAAASMLLESEVGRLYVPSSATASSLIPFGSHPLTDPLWSIDTLDVVHDSIGVERFHKVEAIADFEPAFTALRPCGVNEDGKYNCGRCNKCQYTMFMLAAVGALERFPVFPIPLEEALERQSVRLVLRPSPGMWFESLRLAVERIDVRDAKRLKKTLRSSSILGREHRKQMRRVIRRIVKRNAKRVGGR